jgi:Grx4 family monothiol glutaredoxin
MSLTPEIRDAIDGLLRENRVVLFMKGNRAQPQCGFSARTVEALDMILPDYEVVDVLKNPEVREGIKAYGNWPTIPQLYVAGELVGGCDIVKEMFDSGELGTLLGVTATTPEHRSPSTWMPGAQRALTACLSTCSTACRAAAFVSTIRTRQPAEASRKSQSRSSTTITAGGVPSLDTERAVSTSTTVKTLPLAALKSALASTVLVPAVVKLTV